jgi:AraC-like DNA-binding protein
MPCRTVKPDGWPVYAILTFRGRWRCCIATSPGAGPSMTWVRVPPMQYLTNWRMQVATEKLRKTSASLAQIAEVVGYDSEAAFSRAFKKAFGAAPATWRRSNSEPTSRRHPQKLD